MLRIYSFIGASSDLTCWRAFIAEPSVEFVSAKQFSWVSAVFSREDAILRLFSHCLNFFEVDSLEELELKLAVFSRKTLECMLGIKERL